MRQPELEESNKSFLSHYLSSTTLFPFLSLLISRKRQLNFACFCFKVQILSLHTIPPEECILSINSLKPLTHYPLRIFHL